MLTTVLSDHKDPAPLPQQEYSALRTSGEPSVTMAPQIYLSLFPTLFSPLFIDIGSHLNPQ